MTTQLLTDKHSDILDGVLNCYDRVVVTGSLVPLCYAHGMTGYLYGHGIRIFDYAQFAKPLTEQIRANVEEITRVCGIEIEFIRKKNFRQEARVKEILEKRSDHPGLVHIFSAMERCESYRPWHDKATGKTYVKRDSGKCLHYYFYFIDEEMGLCYLRVPTWCPFRLQFYFNAHNWLARQLEKHGIAFEKLENAFIHIADYEAANKLAAQFDITQLHSKLDSLAQRYCPMATTLNLLYHWSIMQAEYATDLVFKRQADLQSFYPHLLETLVHAVKPADIATFLGRKLHGNYQGEMGNRFNVRLLGTRIKHQMGSTSIKMYDKFGLILRIEVTVNDVSFFKHYRHVQHRDGSITTTWASMKKSIYSLPPLQETLLAANQRYLKFISDVETQEVGVKKLQQLTETKMENGHRHKGFNLLAEEDTSFFRLLIRGEFCISGFTNKNLREHLHKSSSQITRLIKRLRVHGLIKKVVGRYKYYITEFGRQVVMMILKLREMYIIPKFAYDL